MAAAGGGADAPNERSHTILADDFVSEIHPLFEHTIEQAARFWRQYKLQDAVEENVFIRGFLAFRYRENFPYWFTSPSDNAVDADPNTETILRLQVCDYIYTRTEILSLRQSWTTEVFIPSGKSHAWIAKQWRLHKKQWRALQRLSASHALLLVMCIFAAITQGMDQASMTGANISAPEALAINIMNTAASNITSKPEPAQVPLTANTWKFGLINGAPFLFGPLTGLLITDPLSERWGRLTIIFFAGLTSFATVIASASIHKWWELLICRACLGIGMAGKASIVPILLSETSPKHMRGFLVMMWQLLDAFGIAAASIANIIVYHLNPAQSWRWMFVAAGIPALLLFSLVPFCQESPRWLLKRGDTRVKDAFESLKALHGQPSPIVACGELYLLHTRLQQEQHKLGLDSPNQQSAYQQTQPPGISSGTGPTRGSHGNETAYPPQEQIPLTSMGPNEAETPSNQAGPGNQNAIPQQQHSSGGQRIPSIKHVGFRSRWKLMREPHMRRANYAAAAVMISQQLCGINLLAFLATTFFRNSILKDPNSSDTGDNYRLLALALGFGLVNFLATFLAAPYIDAPDRGRRFLLNLSFPSMAVCLLVSGLLLLAPSRDGSGRAQPVVIAFHYIFLILFTIAYSIGEGPAAFVICSEVFQSFNRELGMSLAVVWNFEGAGILALLAPALTKYEGQHYLLLGCFFTNLLAWLLCFVLVPDTVNTDLEDISKRLAIPTKAAIIFYLTWLRDRMCRLFNKGGSDDLDDIEDWFETQIHRITGGVPTNGDPPTLSWQLLWTRN